VIGARGIWIAALAAIAIGSGFLIGYPAEVAAVTTIALAAYVSLITAGELAARAELRRRPAPRRADALPLRQLRQVDKTLAAARASEIGVDRHLRPLFRAIAATRLARRGVDLDHRPDEARAILGEELWELVRSDRPRASNLFAGGLSTAGLQSLIEGLERI
jgi:hypothetical protein